MLKYLIPLMLSACFLGRPEVHFAGDRGFTQEQREAIDAAAREWSEATGYDVRVMRWDSDWSEEKHTLAVACLGAPTDRSIAWTTPHGSVFIIPSKVPDGFWDEVVLHEIGHVLGCKHHEFGVMEPSVGHYHHLTAADVACAR